MCNINLIFNKSREKSLLPSMYMNVASFNSYKHNNHGEGMVGLRNKHINIQKSLRKLVFKQQYWMLASHQRLATIGEKNNLNTQPIVTQDFYIMHNGVFSGLGDFAESDTVKFATILQGNYIKYGDVAKAIQETHKTVRGWYSVLIYHRGKQKLYYYKDNDTKMHYIENKEWFVMSTEKENIYYARNFFKIHEDIKTLNSFVVYDVFNGMEEIATFHHPKPEQTYLKGFYSSKANQEMFGGEWL